MNGEVLWVVPFSSPTYFHVSGRLRVHTNGDVSVLGCFENDLDIAGISLHSVASMDGFVARFDTTGACQAVLQFGKISSAFKGSILPVRDGLLISCPYDSTFTLGNVSLPTTGTDKMYSQDLVLLKLDTLAGFTGIERMVLEEELHIYANPNNGICTVDLPDGVAPGSEWQLVIYDNTGHAVERSPLVITADGVIRLDVRAQAKGIYHVELIGAKRRYSGRMVFE